MGIQLRNRKSIQQDLSTFIEKVAVPPSLIRGICDADVTSDEFAISMDILGAKLRYASRDAQLRNSAAYRDVAPELERLRIKTIGRCRDLLMERIFALSTARTNIQIKQDVLLRYKTAAAFLKFYGGDIYKEVGFVLFFNRFVFEKYYYISTAALHTLITNYEILPTKQQ